MSRYLFVRRCFRLVLGFGESFVSLCCSCGIRPHDSDTAPSMVTTLRADLSRLDERGDFPPEEANGNSNRGDLIADSLGDLAPLGECSRGECLLGEANGGTIESAGNCSDIFVARLAIGSMENLIPFYSHMPGTIFRKNFKSKTLEGANFSGLGFSVPVGNC
jgi:hypothetical protein